MVVNLNGPLKSFSKRDCKSCTELKEEVKRNIDALFEDGAYVLANVHNLQANVPIGNILAMLDAVREYR
jgi:uroporphyrinogen-III decarboxylase